MLPTPELSVAFAKVKGDLCDSDALYLPNPEKLLVLETDASSVAVGVVLKEREGEEEVSTLFYSLAVNSAQRNNSTYEQVLLAVE